MAGLEEHVTCSVCMDLYNDPLALPCLHSFCRHCLQGLFSSSLTLSCPECRKEVPVKSRDINDLPRNFQLAGIVESYKRENNEVLRKRAEQLARETTCNQHKSPGEILCKTCSQTLCIKCLTSTQHSKKHKLKLIQNSRSRDGVASGELTCGEHGMQFRLYCTQCESIVCMECVVHSHGSHNLATITDTYEYNLVCEDQTRSFNVRIVYQYHIFFIFLNSSVFYKRIKSFCT